MIIVPALYAQGPWVKPKGEGYSHLALGTIPTYSKVFNGNFTTLEDLDASIFEFSLQSYSEYGFAKNWQLTANVPFQFINLQALDNTGILQDGNISGFGNIEIGTKYQLLKGNVPVALGVNIGLPTGASNDQTGLRTAYQSTFLFPFLSVGKGFNNKYAYLYGGTGLFAQDISHDIRLGGEYGFFLFDKLWTIFNVQFKQSMFNRETVELPTYLATSLYVNNQWYNSLSMKLLYEFDETSGLNFSTNLISLQADNLPFQRPFSLGYYLKW